ncbi:hypothetical protein AVEN_165381-1 [Araneus ventricosus]|uniref:Uncharacterized protein n=1 Tax=Araneus ventricosus TaxID=182803 RepID=A0A4Y2AVQ3_ARAVE|nr:hypothetical protein AVEN_165381-1 [Araneus ventricosus]
MELLIDGYGSIKFDRSWDDNSFAYPFVNLPEYMPPRRKPILCLTPACSNCPQDVSSWSFLPRGQVVLVQFKRRVLLVGHSPHTFKVHHVHGKHSLLYRQDQIIDPREERRRWNVVSIRIGRTNIRPAPPGRGASCMGFGV